MLSPLNSFRFKSDFYYITVANMYVCMYECMYISIHIVYMHTTYIYIYICCPYNIGFSILLVSTTLMRPSRPKRFRLQLYIYIYIYIYMYVCMYVCIVYDVSQISGNVCMYVFMYACIYVCIYVCMHKLNKYAYGN